MFEKLYLAATLFTAGITLCSPIWGLGFVVLFYLINPGQFFLESVGQYRIVLFLSILLFLRAALRGFVVFGGRYVCLVLLLLTEVVFSVMFTGELSDEAIAKTIQLMKVSVFSIIALWMIRNRHELQTYIVFIVIGAIANGVFAVYEMFSPLAMRVAEGMTRSVGFQKDPNDLGGLLVALLPLAYYLYRFTDRRFERLLGICGIGAAVCGIFSTVSRSSFLVLTAVGALIILRNVKNASSIIIASLCALFFVYFAADAFRERVQIDQSVSGRIVTDSSTETRLFLMGTALKVWLHYPVFGAGNGNFDTAAEHDLGIRLKHGSAHNGYLQVLAEFGTLGFICFGLVFWEAWKQSTRLKQAGEEFFVTLGTYCRLSIVGWLLMLMFAIPIASPFLWIAITLPMIVQKVRDFELETAGEPASQ